jgi:1-aminocyclopropane-1-carboxylate deaminase/D-cysteine desulfhydrase-like pyridoxal-dependent ACC family enzyme
MSISISEYVSRLSQITTDAVNEKREEIYIRNGNQLLANIKNRIQREGKDSSGATMPPYSTKPAYYTRDKFVKKGSFKPKGKSGKKTFVNGNDHKSMYLANGYKEFREVQGRQTSKKDYTLSGDLMLSYVLGTSQNAILLGFNQEKQSKKRKGLEKQNGGNVFPATNSEMDDFNKGVIQNELEIINQAFT